MEAFQTHIRTSKSSIVPVVELESVRCRIFSLMSIILFLDKFINSLLVRPQGTHVLIKFQTEISPQKLDGLL